MSIIIAVSNQKGGVAKTTTVYNLGACLSMEHGKKVLLADIDPQANLSEYLGYEHDDNLTMTQLITYACMGNNITKEMVFSAIHHNDYTNMDYIPSDINLAGSESMMAAVISRETILKRILTENVIKDYDFVIIDCLPSLSSLLINALTAADKVLIPVQTQKFSLDGLQALDALFHKIKDAINPKIEYLGILPTMADRTKISKAAIETLTHKFGAKVFNTHVSKSVEAAKSTENKLPLCVTDSKLGHQYKALAEEVLERCCID